MSDQARLSWAMAVSVMLHFTVLAALPLLRQPLHPIVESPSIEVDLAPLPAPPPAPEPAPDPGEVVPPPPLLLPERQIVSPSEAGEEHAPEKTRLLSDRDSTVAEQMVQRGDSQPSEQNAGSDQTSGDPEPERSAARSNQDSLPGERLAALPSLDQLLPKAGDIIRQTPPEPTQPSKRKQTDASLLAGNPVVLSSRPGTADYLPSIREGDITLLNTKAELFAPFVRRVAARVFQHLEIALKRTSRQAAGGSGREFALVEALMSKEGQLIGTRLLKRETGTAIAAYRELLNATRPDVFFDANPPPGAEANDGNIHFILLIDLMVRSVADPRGGSPRIEYYGVAGVGLDSPPKEG